VFCFSLKVKQLLRATPVDNNQFIFFNNDTIVTLGPQNLGGIAQYNVTTNTWGSFTSFLQYEEIYAIFSFKTLGEGNILVLGNFKTSNFDESVTLNNVAICNTLGCKAMGKGCYLHYSLINLLF
jgi:hypothetical protein